jgi:hypothetical protein
VSSERVQMPVTVGQVPNLAFASASVSGIPQSSAARPVPLVGHLQTA